MSRHGIKRGLWILAVSALAFTGSRGQQAPTCAKEINQCVGRMEQYEAQFKGYLPYFDSTETWKEACSIVKEVDTCVRASFLLCTAPERVIWITVVDAYDHICAGDEHSSEYVLYRGCYGLGDTVRAQDACNATYTQEFGEATAAYNTRAANVGEYSNLVCQTFNNLFTCMRDGLIDECGDPASRWMHDHFRIVFAGLLGQITCEMVPFEAQQSVVAECQLYQILQCLDISHLHLDPDALPTYDQATASSFCNAHLQSKNCLNSLGDCERYSTIYRGFVDSRDFLCNNIDAHQLHASCLRGDVLDLNGTDFVCKKTASDAYRRHDLALEDSGDEETYNRDTCKSLNDYWRCVMVPVHDHCGCDAAEWIGVYNVLLSRQTLDATQCKIELAAIVPSCPAPTIPTIFGPVSTTPGGGQTNLSGANLCTQPSPVVMLATVTIILLNMKSILRL